MSAGCQKRSVFFCTANGFSGPPSWRVRLGAGDTSQRLLLGHWWMLNPELRDFSAAAGSAAAANAACHAGTRASSIRIADRRQVQRSPGSSDGRRHRQPSHTGNLAAPARTCGPSPLPRTSGYESVALRRPGRRSSIAQPRQTTNATDAVGSHIPR